jgi:hypothetical protein
MGFLDFLGNIGNIFGEIASLIDAIFGILWNVMISLFTFIWNTLVAVFNFLVSVFQNVAKFFGHFWSDFVKPAINGLFNLVAKIYSAIHRVLDPLMRWVQKIRAWYDTHILPMLLKQIQMIQRIRQFLSILRVFHVKWAQQLDDKLAGLQGKITDSIELVRGYLNLVISWIALITDQNSVIRRSVLGSWLLSNLAALKRIVGYGDGRQITSDEQAAMDKAHNRYTTANVHDHIQSLAMTGLTADDLADRAAARTALEAATGAPLPF